MKARKIYPTWNFWGAQIVLLMIHLLRIFQCTWTLPSVRGLILMWWVRWSFLIILWCNRDLDILNISIVWFLVASQLDHYRQVFLIDLSFCFRQSPDRDKCPVLFDLRNPKALVNELLVLGQQTDAFALPWKEFKISIATANLSFSFSSFH